MAAHASRALTVVEAKNRLWRAAEEDSLAGWVTEHPWQTVGASVAAGLLLGTFPGLARVSVYFLRRYAVAHAGRKVLNLILSQSRR